MPKLKTYDLFISHAWRYGEAYERLVHLLHEAKDFKWRNYSVPQGKPVIAPDEFGDDALLLQKLDRQIRLVNCVLVLSGMYVHYKKWIQAEIDIATKYGKPIIGVKPRGSRKTPAEVHTAANVMVGWKTASIIEAVRKYSL